MKEIEFVLFYLILNFSFEKAMNILPDFIYFAAVLGIEPRASWVLGKLQPQQLCKPHGRLECSHQWQTQHWTVRYCETWGYICLLWNLELGAQNPGPSWEGRYSSPEMDRCGQQEQQDGGAVVSTHPLLLIRPSICWLSGRVQGHQQGTVQTRQSKWMGMRPMALKVCGFQQSSVLRES